MEYTVGKLAKGRRGSRANAQRKNGGITANPVPAHHSSAPLQDAGLPSRGSIEGRVSKGKKVGTKGTQQLPTGKSAGIPGKKRAVCKSNALK